MKDTVRLLEVELNGFKNVKHGVVQMPSVFDKDYFNYTSDILGIYGQNGSGKTAIIESMAFVQSLLKGDNLSEKFVNYISKDTDKCNIRVRFSIDTLEKKALVDYSVSIMRTKESFGIMGESISSYDWNGEKFETKKTLLRYDVSSKVGEIKPKYRYENIIKADKENKINLMVAKRISQKDNCSFFFGNEGKNLFLDSSGRLGNDEYAYIIRDLSKYAILNLFVIESGHSATISMGLLIPLSFRLKNKEGIAKGDLSIRLDEPSNIHKREYELVESLISEMNIVLCTLIPGLSIEIKNYGEQTLENGEEGYRIELLSKREEKIIPLIYESEGIIKIISILNVLMCIYNNPGTCLIIDEFDSGIFEFLLGEILAVIDKGAKGQILFTSHNLRALEMIDRKNLLFSTTNPDCRYIHLKNVKKNNNIRDLYLRTIILGGQEEEIYAVTDSVAIRRAFIKAGKVALNGK
jgi:AAA15 family ATPase/GTPase